MGGARRARVRHMAFPVSVLQAGARACSRTPAHLLADASHARAPTRLCARARQHFGTAHGGYAKLEIIDAKLALLDDKNRAKELKKHADRHLAQQLRREPLLPFHFVVFDPMHGVHNEINVLLDEAVHKHLMVESTDPVVNEIIERKTIEINQLWKDANLSKFIQFGKDGKGAHSHALNGPAFKDMMRAPKLVVSTIEKMKEVYALLESKRLTPDLHVDATGVGADRGEEASKTKRGGKAKGKDPPTPPQKKGRKKKKRGVHYDEDDEEEQQAPQPAVRAQIG